MKTEEEIRKVFDDFINGLNKTMSDISRSFHKHDDIVGWDKTSPSAIDKLQKYLLDYRTVMAMRDTAETLKKMIFEEEEKVMAMRDACITLKQMIFEEEEK